MIPSAPRITHLSEVGDERKGFFTEPEIRRLITYMPAEIADFVLFSYIVGMRRGGIASLTWADCTVTEIRLPASNDKIEEGNVLPLEGELGEIIRRRRAAAISGCPFIFHRGGRPIGDFRKVWRRALQLAGLPVDRLFHDLRRCASKNLHDAGVPQAIAMKITGHRTDSMFRRYAIVEPRMKREALRKLEVFRAEQLEAQCVPVATAAQIN